MMESNIHSKKTLVTDELFSFLTVKRGPMKEDQKRRAHLIAVARGEKAADLVIRNINWLDVFCGEFRSGDIALADGFIAAVGSGLRGHEEYDASGGFLVPGFIDAHVHLESSMLSPRRYEELVLPLGTTAVIWDPHELANALGTAGISWALRATDHTRLSVYVMAPSCVPATSPQMGLETSGFTLTAKDIEPFKKEPRVIGLAEMMNFPGLFFGDEDVHEKMSLFADRMIDGHCPHLNAADIQACAAAGIRSCHETISREEGLSKLQSGMALLIREGSCARNSDELLPLLTSKTAHRIAFCSDDLNPVDIEERGHINHIIDKALKQKIAPEAVFCAASFSAAQIYGLKNRGAIAPGYHADMVLVRPADGRSFESGMTIGEVFKNGVKVQAAQAANTPAPPLNIERNINLRTCFENDFMIRSAWDAAKVRVIDLVPMQIVTSYSEQVLPVQDGLIHANIEKDILKIAVLERYHNTFSHTVGFVRGFGLKKGAIAASISHDSHNVVVVGCDDSSMALAVNRISAMDGGIAVIASPEEISELPLPIGGLISDAPAHEVIAALRRLKEAVKRLGSPLAEPFLQMAFLALPVIPELKITDKGLVRDFKILPLIVD
jgi:adenine deaminase